MGGEGKKHTFRGSRKGKNQGLSKEKKRSSGQEKKKGRCARKKKGREKGTGGIAKGKSIQKEKGGQSVGGRERPGTRGEKDHHIFLGKEGKGGCVERNHIKKSQSYHLSEKKKSRKTLYSQKRAECA